MSRIAAIGAPRELDGFTLAGVELIAADDVADVRTAWSRLDSDVAVLILTPAAERALEDLLPLRSDVIWATLPS